MICRTESYYKVWNANRTMASRNRQVPGSVSHVYRCNQCFKFHLNYLIEVTAHPFSKDEIKVLQERFTLSYSNATPTIKTIIYRKYEDLDSIEDTFQEISLRLWKRYLSANEPNKQKIYNESAWMVAMSKYDLDDLCRNAKRKIELIYCDILPERTPAIYISNNTSSITLKYEFIKPLFKKLTDKQRSVIQLTLSGHNLDAIASIKNMEVDSVRKVLKRASTNIRTFLFDSDLQNKPKGLLAKTKEP